MSTVLKSTLESKISSYFSLDLDGVSDSIRSLPEFYMLLEVLKRAIQDLSKVSRNTTEEISSIDKYNYSDSLSWFNEEFVDSPGVTSFQFISELLNLDPIVFRKAIFSYNSVK